MPQFIDNLATYLQTQGHGTVGSDLFKGSSPDSPNDLITVVDTGGIPNELNFRGAGLEVATVQVLCRNKRQEVARDKLTAISDDLHQLVNTNLGTYTIISALAQDRPAVLNRDDKERWRLVTNYLIRYRLS